MFFFYLFDDVEQEVLPSCVHKSDAPQKCEHGIETTNLTEDVGEGCKFENVHLCHLMNLENHKVGLLS